MNTLRPAKEMSIHQGKAGQTITHEDGTSLDGLYPVADDEDDDE
jgi:hypothetical protein